MLGVARAELSRQTEIGQRFVLAAIQLKTERLGRTCWPYLYEIILFVFGELVSSSLWESAQ